MIENFIYFGIFVILVGFLFVLIPGISYRRKISRMRNRYFVKKVNEVVKKKISLREKIIILDKILHNILLELGYRGTLGEILKKQPEYIAINLEKIWELHKLRNTLVHNIDEDYSDNFLFLKVEEYAKVIRILLKDI